MPTLAAYIGIALAIQTPAQTQNQPDPYFLNWSAKIIGVSNPATIAFPLQNLTNLQYLRYGSRTFGINLEWDASQKNTILLRKPKFGSTESNTSPPRLGELVAVYVVGGGYLRYEERSVGVNLGWSKAPVYEWHIVGAGGVGSIISSKQTLGLLNARVKDFLIYQDRRAGINLGWARSNKTFFSEGRRFKRALKERGHTTMMDLLGKMLDW